MNQQQLATRQERAASEALVIQQVDEGFRVYAVEDPKNRYIVSGPPSAPQCTCPDFQVHRSDPDWQCKHILAVLSEFSEIDVVPEADCIDTQERCAIQDEGRTPRRRKVTPPSPSSNGTTQLLLKRSMSPDGRIDSLSVEFSCPLSDLSVADVKARAKDVLSLQSAILADFMQGAPRNGNGNGGSRYLSQNGNGRSGNGQNAAAKQGNGSPHLAQPADASVPAQLLSIGGMDGKWGRRLFLVFDIDGERTRMFGNKKQLAEAIGGAGYLSLAVNISEGVNLNVPCRVTTEPSSDGRFTNVTKVLPPAERS